jgi:uncharacterized protein YecE (DUF72 family)
MIKIGTSGFSFADWRGTIYPKTLQPKDALAFYEQELGFDCVEINSTYYTLVSDKSFAGMEKKTSPGFEFVVKGYRGITHDPFDSRLGDKKPSKITVLNNVDRFCYSLGPLKEKGKLGGVLLQFPVFFEPSVHSEEYLLDCKKRFGDTPLIIEFRNRAWSKPGTFEFLKSNGLGYCAVDEPKLPHLMPFVNAVTSDIAYLRFHGRSPNWFNAPLEERYNYLYTDNELESFLPELKKMDSSAKQTFIFFNNCHQGSAARNASRLKELLGLK